MESVLLSDVSLHILTGINELESSDVQNRLDKVSLVLLEPEQEDSGMMHLYITHKNMLALFFCFLAFSAFF